MFIFYLYFWHLSCLVFFEFPGSMIWCSTLIWEKFSVIIASNISSAPFSLLLAFALCTCYIFCSCSTVFGYSVLLFYSVFFSLLFNFASFCYHILKFRGSFFSPDQSTNEPIKDILPFHYNVFDL